MTAVYREIKAADPNATIVVVGYPDLLPGNPATALYHCAWLKDPAAVLEFRKVAGLVDSTLKNAALAAGVQYVSSLSALQGHELCTADAWVHRIGLTGGTDRGHPTASGEAAMARVVRTYMLAHNIG